MDLNELRDLLNFMRAEGIEELEVDRADGKIRIRRGAPGPGATPVPASVSPGAPTSPAAPSQPRPAPLATSAGLLTVASPIVGTFYRAPAPDAEAYVEIGQVVKKGQILCVIEAMKLMNEIEAETDGRVIEVLVENAHAVEYGQPLFLIEPTGESRV